MFDPSASGAIARQRVRDRLRSSDQADQERRERGIVDCLANAPLFAQCSKREHRLVAKLAKVKRVPPGTTIVTEGEEGETMFVVLSGHAAVRKSGRKIAELGPGDVVGELAVLGKAPRNATVVTTAEALIATIGRRDVYRLLEDAPGFARKLLEALANRVRDLDTRLVG